ncbi:SDR family NAD(P)-dependent oxidoreductase [Chloroflexota bacterium]
MKLANKVIIVTGSSRGIGKALAIAFSKEGAKVVVAARTEEEGKSGGSRTLPGTIHKTVEEIKAAGGTAIAVKTDVTNEELVNTMAHRTLEEFGRIDVLVNDAGVDFHSLVIDTPLRRWELFWRVNVLGPILCSKAVLPTMMEQRSGSIINITSGSARTRNPGGALYGMTKAALERFTFVLAEEVREYNIAVNALAPGPIKTEAAVLLQLSEDWVGWKSPATVAPAAIFLACQDAKSFTARQVDAPEFRRTWP